MATAAAARAGTAQDSDEEGPGPPPLYQELREAEVSYAGEIRGGRFRVDRFEIELQEGRLYLVPEIGGAVSTAVFVGDGRLRGYPPRRRRAPPARAVLGRASGRRGLRPSRPVGGRRHRGAASRARRPRPRAPARHRARRPAAEGSAATAAGRAERQPREPGPPRPVAAGNGHAAGRPRLPARRARQQGPRLADPRGRAPRPGRGGPVPPRRPARGVRQLDALRRPDRLPVRLRRPRPSSRSRSPRTPSTTTRRRVRPWGCPRAPSNPTARAGRRGARVPRTEVDMALDGDGDVRATAALLIEPLEPTRGLRLQISMMLEVTDVPVAPRPDRSTGRRGPARRRPRRPRRGPRGPDRADRRAAALRAGARGTDLRGRPLRALGDGGVAPHRRRRRVVHPRARLRGTARRSAPADPRLRAPRHPELVAAARRQPHQPPRDDLPDARAVPRRQRGDPARRARRGRHPASSAGRRTGRSAAWPSTTASSR